MTTTNASQRTGRTKRGNNEGSVYQRKDGRWVGAVTLPDGNRKSLYARTRAEVQRKVTATLRDLDQGLPVTSASQRFDRYLTRWLADVVQPSVRPSTYESYARIVRLHLIPTLGTYTLDQITPARVQAMMRQKQDEKLSPGSIAICRAVLRNALGRAVKWGLIARNAAMLVDPPYRPHRETPHLEADEIATLLASLKGDRLEAIVTLMLALGLRRGEALGLRWSDLDFDQSLLHVRGQWQKRDGAWVRSEPKSGTARRTLTMPAFVVAALKDHRTRQLEERLRAGACWQDYDTVFPARTGAPMEPTALNMIFRSRVKRAGIPPIPVHGLRHSCATFLLSKGVTLGEIQKLLGHSSIQTTSNIYAHFSREISARAAQHMEQAFAAR